MSTQLDPSLDPSPTRPAIAHEERQSGNGWMPGTNYIAFGGDYNPEQWPRDVWLEDVALMKEAGVNLVSIGIFSWALLEPREGEFDFGWLDDVIELLAAAGIGISLGTPTASPPAWFWKKYPQARPVTRDGVPLGFGSRGMASPSSPEYAAAAARITRELGQRYGQHPGLKIWHVHNEYGAPVSECYSAYSTAAFRLWLRARYGSLDALNTAWGTTFWGQRYGEWDEIDAPRRAASVVNPSQRLDFARFSNFALLECFRRERDILHELSPGVPVTTNFMATNCPAVDYWKWADEVDIVSNDHYLTAERDDSHIMLSMDADLARSLARGRPWILMEHSTSAVNWQPRNIAKSPGELARNSMTHFARGADSILFFQWRASLFGAEKFHSAMLPHAGAESRTFAETRALGARLGALGGALGSRIRPRVAILWDWESNWALSTEWRPSIDLDPRRQIETFYTRLWLDGVTTDFAHPEDDLSRYDLVIAPSLYLVSDAGSANLSGFVAGGGTLVVSYFSGAVDPTDSVRPGGVPAALSGLLGIRIPEFRPLRSGERVQLDSGQSGFVWSEEIELGDAEAVASYSPGQDAAGPAITRNSFGAGAAWYLSTEFTVGDLSRVLEGAYGEAGIRVNPAAARGLESVVRHGEQSTFATFINHGSDDEIVGADVDSDAVQPGSRVVVPAGSVVVVLRRPGEQQLIYQDA